MPAMRALLVFLILANLLAMASTQGWLGTSTPQGEPERLSNQLNADRIVLRPGEPAPAPHEPGQAAPAANPPTPADQPATAAPPDEKSGEICVALAGLTEVQADTLAQTLAGNAGLRTERRSGTTPNAWWVRIPPAGGREGAERRVTELRALGIEDLFIVQDSGPNQYAVSLGLFKTEPKAQQHLAFLQGKRVRGAAITTRSTVVHRIEVRGPATTVQTASQSRAVLQSGATVSECKP